MSKHIKSTQHSYDHITGEPMPLLLETEAQIKDMSLNRKSLKTIKSPILAPPSSQPCGRRKFAADAVCFSVVPETLVSGSYEGSIAADEIIEIASMTSEEKRDQGLESAKQNSSSETKTQASTLALSEPHLAEKSSSLNQSLDFLKTEPKLLSAKSSMQSLSKKPTKKGNKGGILGIISRSASMNFQSKDQVNQSNASLHHSAESILIPLTGGEISVHTNEGKDYSPNASKKSLPFSIKSRIRPGPGTQGVFGTLMEADQDENVPLINLIYPRTMEPCTEDVTSTKSRRIFKRRVTTFENTVMELASSSAALFRDRKRSLLAKAHKYVCTGSELATWFLGGDRVGESRFFTTTEASQYLDSMVQFGYLISVEYSTSFDMNDQLYTVQTPLHWMFERTKPTDIGKLLNFSYT
jgi:hypothetical protein